MLSVHEIDVYYGKVQALSDVSFEARKGKVTSIIGGNGAGKTTTLRAISGLLRTSGGEIYLQGKPISKIPSDQIIRQGVIHVPEGRGIFSDLTVEENLKMGGFLRKDYRNLSEAYEKVFNYFPILKERFKQPARSLSGGEQQMLALGRGLVANPRLMMIDEMSMGLAPIVIQDLTKIIKEISEEGVTILLIEQNARLALSISHYSYIMQTGRIVKEGSSQELLQDPDVHSYYLGEQFK